LQCSSTNSDNDDNEELAVSSLCTVSNDLDHDVPFVHETQQVGVVFIKRKFSKVNSLLYFSDDCTAQYKNCENFINLCHHESDFNLSASWCLLQPALESPYVTAAVVR
jgi:hypothetical protein